MDSKKRHELEQNELAKWIVAQYEDWVRPNSSWFGYAVLGVLVVVAILIGTARVNSWNRSASWKQYYSALNSPEADTELELLANSTSSVVGVHARLALAERQLTEGCSQVFIDKMEAVKILDKAIASFQQVQRATKDPSILQEAGFKLGYCWEALAAARVGDDLAKAEEAYQKVIDRWEDSFAGQRAKKQLSWIQQPATVEFLALTAAKTVESLETEDFRGSFGFGDPFAEPGQIDFSAFEQGTPSEAQSTVTDEEPKPETENGEQ